MPGSCSSWQASSQRVCSSRADRLVSCALRRRRRVRGPSVTRRAICVGGCVAVQQAGADRRAYAQREVRSRISLELRHLLLQYAVQVGIRALDRVVQPFRSEHHLVAVSAKIHRRLRGSSPFCRLGGRAASDVNLERAPRGAAPLPEHGDHHPDPALADQLRSTDARIQKTVIDRGYATFLADSGRSAGVMQVDAQCCECRAHVGRMAGQVTNGVERTGARTGADTQGKAVIPGCTLAFDQVTAEFGKADCCAWVVEALGSEAAVACQPVRVNAGTCKQAWRAGNSGHRYALRGAGASVSRGRDLFHGPGLLAFQYGVT